MRVLLVRPPLPKRSIGAAHASLCEPLELEVLAGNLRDHDVTVLDMRVDKRAFDDVLEEVKPDIVGVTAGTVEVNTAWAVLRRVKEVFPAVATIVGGPHGTARPEDFAGSFVNAIAIGQGVATFREIVEAREKGTPLESIPGLVVNSKGQQVETEPRSPKLNLGVFPVPDRSVTEQYRNDYYQAWIKPVTLVQGSSGAIYSGTVGAPAGEARVVQDVERIAAELVEHQTAICMADDDALAEPTRVATLCALLKEAAFNQPLYLCASPEAIVENPEIIEDLAELGLYAVALALSGPEVGGPTGTQKKAIDILHRNGVCLSGEFEVRPEFNVIEIKKLGEYTEKYKIEFPLFSCPTPYPGTDLYERHRDVLGTPDWELFDRVHSVLPTRLPLRKFYSELSRLYERYYGLKAIPRIFRAVPVRQIPIMSRQLRRFTRRLRSAHLDQESGLHPS